MTCTIKLKMDNAAFEESGELSRILQELSRETQHIRNDGERMDPFDRRITVRDANGNNVGHLQISY